MTRIVRMVLTVVLVGASLIGASRIGPSPRGQGQQNRENAALTEWRLHDYSGNAFVGSKVCAQCHTKEASTQIASPMAHALSLSADCQILGRRPRLVFRNGSYTYQIIREGNQSIYTVTDGATKVSEPIRYCFGLGKVGQTYLIKYGGQFYETRLSYYQGIEKLDFTTGHPRAEPRSLPDALGRPLSAEETGNCFGCHSTASLDGSQFQEDRVIPGITCEGCHGPGQKHLVAVKDKKLKNLQILNPGNLDADTLSQEFCGTCHRSFDDVMLLPGQGGINNIRFQPYRIFNSPGHKGDLRINCLACHNPHDKLERKASAYDSKCLACHLADSHEAKTSHRTAPACPISKQECVTCHMPRIEVTEMHNKFTDHWIRIVKPGAPTPN
ncbi:MAG: multiheme c-type cytochrome [bacterium]